MKPTMEGGALDHKPSVLIVDRSEETREVLQTALNRRGVQTYTAKHASEGVVLGRRHHPNLIILDLETDGVRSLTWSISTRLFGQVCKTITSLSFFWGTSAATNRQFPEANLWPSPITLGL